MMSGFSFFKKNKITRWGKYQLPCFTLDLHIYIISKNKSMERCTLLSLCFLLHSGLFAQFQHLDFIGAGHDKQVTVTASSSSSNISGEKTVDGFPIQSQDQLKDASRFLAQATFGADMPTIRMTAAMGYEAWLDEQFSLPQVSMLQEMYSHGTLYDDEIPNIPEDNVYHVYFRSAWLTNNLSTPDILRQRMAFIWSQIMVINDKSDFYEDVGQTLANYYDVLAENSFGNYQNLLTDVTLSPAMGNFLSHYNNPKADPSQNIHPDENYAREIMQLFSIGLWELNQNGTRKYDSAGQFIPTYTNADIKEFAQVFTGLGNGMPNGIFGEPIDELADEPGIVMLNPMKMYNDFHDTSEKHLLNGVVLPANQSGMEDINQTLAHLSNHENTAPFISKSLIRFMTTSNPSGTYVSDVASVFNPSEENNFQNVLRAILLHPEARNCVTSNYTFGKLREPMVRHLNFLKAFHFQPNQYRDYRNELFCFEVNTGQVPLAAPSVFNYFLPEYQPQGPIGQNYLVAPEFQILNSTNAIGLVNEVDIRAVNRAYLEDVCITEEYDDLDPSEQLMDYSEVLALTNNPTELVNYLDILLANGLLEDDTKTIITDAVSQLSDSDERLNMALYLILISPDYAILK